MREAWPSSVTATTLTAGRIASAPAAADRVRVGGGGTVFGDGIEADRVAVDWGQRIEIGRRAGRFGWSDDTIRPPMASEHTLLPGFHRPAA